MPKSTRTDYSRSKRTAYVPYPAIVLDPEILDQIGVIAGTRPDESPPKVVMTVADWSRVVADPRGPQAIQLTGETWQDNPSIPAPAQPLPADASEGEPGPAPKRPYVYRPKPKPSPELVRLRALPPAEAIELAQRDHAARLVAGESLQVSGAKLLRALNAIERGIESHVEPRPLTRIEGEDPPTPTELRQMARDCR